MKPHKHAEVIKAWADGQDIQHKRCGIWQDTHGTLAWDNDTEYRVKPAAPKWPQTTMMNKDINTAFADGEPILVSYHVTEKSRMVANAAIAHACEAGQVVPADKVREIEAKARAEGKREGLHPVAVIQAACNHLRIKGIDAETIQIILLKAAAL